MPIFEYEGKKYNVKEEHIENFINDFPNATTILERDGKKYRVKSSDYSSFLSEHITKPTKEDIPTSNFTGKEQTVATNPVDEVKQESNNEPEYAKGFGEGFKQGWKGLVRGAHYFIGETANLLTGSTIDEEKALERIAELERDGIDIESAIAPLDKAQEMYYKNATNQSGETKLAGLTDDDITYAQKELEKDAINRTIRKYIEKAGGIDKAKLMLAERASEETWGDRQIKIASQELAELKPTKGFGAWVGNLVPQMIPSAASIHSADHLPRP